MADKSKAPDKGASESAEQTTPQVSIRKIYIKDSSFESPQTPDVFAKNLSPGVEIRMVNKVNRLEEEGLYEIIFGVTVTAKDGDKTIYLAEVHQGGIFLIVGYPEKQISAIVATVCPNVLFPFAREAISDLVTRGGFSPLLLAPVNFEALYAKQMQQQQQQQNGNGDKPKSQPH